MCEVRPGQVRRGDTITWRSAGGVEASALVLYKTASAVTVLTGGIGLPVDWRQVCGHEPLGDNARTVLAIAANWGMSPPCPG
jgi:hypothetical protein